MERYAAKPVTTTMDFKTDSSPTTLMLAVAATLFPMAALALSYPVSQESPAMVAQSPAEAKVMKVGTQAPDATLQTQEGKSIKLSSLVKGKPTVVIFYRGGWCPFCNTHLAEMGRIEGDLRQKGFQIIAITPDSPAQLGETVDKNHLGYKLYSDVNAEALKKFGVAFRLDDGTFSKYKNQYGLDLEQRSGKDHHILPVPSLFVLDKSGKIVFTHSNPDYTKRMKSADLLKAIDSL